MKKHIQKSLTLLDCRPKILFMKDSTEGIAEGQTTASAGNGLNTGVAEDRENEK